MSSLCVRVSSTEGGVDLGIALCSGVLWAPARTQRGSIEWGRSMGASEQKTRSDLRRWDLPPDLAGDSTSIGSLHGSARGGRNVSGRLRAMSRLGELSGGSLLDVGCGTGEYTVRLATAFDRTVAIDVEPQRLDILREAAPAGLEVHQMSVNAMELASHSFDVVTMIEVLEHLSEPVGALTEIRRVLCPGGSLFLTTPARRWPLEQHGVILAGRRRSSVTLPFVTWIPPLHRRVSDAAAFTESSLRRLGRESGLEFVGCTYMMPPLDSMSGRPLVHRVLDAAERALHPWYGQTIVAHLRA